MGGASVGDQERPGQTDGATAAAEATSAFAVSDSNSSSQLACTAFGCGDRIDCSLVGNEVHELVALSGYWRPAKYTDSFFDCGDGGANCYGGPFEDQCANYSTGPLCKMCLDGYIRRAGVCVLCPPPQNPVYMWSLTPFAAVAVTAALAWFLGHADKVGRLTRGLQQDHNWELKEKSARAFAMQGRKHSAGLGDTAKSKRAHLLLTAASAYRATHTASNPSAGSAFGLAAAAAAATNSTSAESEGSPGELHEGGAEAEGKEGGDVAGADATAVSTEVADASEAERLEDEVEELKQAKDDARGAIDDTKVQTDLGVQFRST
jgi:hypothetical protein